MFLLSCFSYRWCVLRVMACKLSSCLFVCEHICGWTGEGVRKRVGENVVDGFCVSACMCVNASASICVCTQGISVGLPLPTALTSLRTKTRDCSHLPKYPTHSQSGQQHERHLNNVQMNTYWRILTSHRYVFTQSFLSSTERNPSPFSIAIRPYFRKK